jgi:hypothetical protein
MALVEGEATIMAQRKMAMSQGKMNIFQKKL